MFSFRANVNYSIRQLEGQTGFGLDDHWKIYSDISGTYGLPISHMIGELLFFS